LKGIENQIVLKESPTKRRQYRRIYTTSMGKWFLSFLHYKQDKLTIK